MPYFYANTNCKFLWKPYARVSIYEDTATIYVNDFFTQRLSSIKRFGYALTHRLFGWDSSRATYFTENSIKYALLCLTGYPITLNSINTTSTNFNSNPWAFIESHANVDIEELIRLFQEMYPNIKTITCTPEPADYVSSRFSPHSQLAMGLFNTDIKIILKNGMRDNIKEEILDPFQGSPRKQKSDLKGLSKKKLRKIILELKNELSKYDSLLHDLNIPIPNKFDIKDIDVITHLDYNAPLSSEQSMPSKPGLKISFSSKKKRIAFQNHIAELAQAQSPGTCPLVDGVCYDGGSSIALYIRSPQNPGLTTEEKLAPSLAFLTQHFPGFDFAGIVSAKLATESTSSVPSDLLYNEAVSELIIKASTTIKIDCENPTAPKQKP